MSTMDEPAPTRATTSSDSESDSVARPSLYVHEPRPRRAPLEEYYGHGPSEAANVDILDELKTSKMEGIYNLSFLLLTFSLCYFFIRSIVETGFLAGPSAICIDKLLRDVCVLILLMLPLPVAFLFSFCLIWLHVREGIRAREVLVVHGVGIGLFFSTVTAVLFTARLNPAFGVFHGLLCVVVALKQHSFVLTNLLLAEETAKKRLARGKSRTLGRNSSVSSMENSVSTTGNGGGERSGRGQSCEQEIVKKSSSGFLKEATYRSVVYPRNVTLGNFVYYVLAPTLVYETSYPRTRYIRRAYVLWYSLQAVAAFAVQYVLMMQFCVPIWRNAAPTERLLWWMWIKMGLPSFIIWLLMFWGFFHCTLNVLAELTRFADRQFYREWWNATTLHQFWRMWNNLVHEWCLRHLYVESVSRHNLDAKTAAFGTFFMSAVLHEYVCLVGFRILRPYMFVGMMLQIPMMQMSLKWAGTREGNMLMWLMLFSGQSFCSLMYVRDYLNKYGTLMCLETV